MDDRFAQRMQWIIVILLPFLIINGLNAQTTCFSGALGIYSSCGSPPGGQGCVAGCNLSEFNWFGPMCNGASSTGTCSNGSHAIVTTFGIPAGCTATISATVRTRCNGIGCTCGNTGSGTGCGASGLDSGDQLRVGGNSTSPVYTNSQVISGSPSTATTTNASGYTLTGTGSSNAGLLLSYAQTGGTMFVGLTADRSDEIVTYTMTIQSGCNCSAILPVDILAFNAFKNSRQEIELYWLALNETNIQKYEISKSEDGLNFSKIGEVKPIPVKEAKKRYTFTDNSSTSNRIIYYKLTIINNENTEEKFYIKDVLLTLNFQPVRYVQDENQIEFIFDETVDLNHEFILMEPAGKIIKSFFPGNPGSFSVSKNGLNKGIYILYQESNNFIPQKIIIH
jgi:hypothetical protein